jgi:hypothetical protein
MLPYNTYCQNYTGFVKIAKKFDKTFPERKGRLKGKICDDGKQTEVFAAKMVRSLSYLDQLAYFYFFHHNIGIRHRTH